VALQTLDAKRKRQLTTAQLLSGSYRKERDTLKDESDALEVQVDELKGDLDELTEDPDTLKDELVGATARIGKLLGERTKVSAALQESKRRIKEQSTVAQRNITLLQQKVKLLQSLHGKSSAEVRTVEALAEARFERSHAIHQQHIDLQRKHDTLNANFRKARSEHRGELERQAKKLERDNKVKLAKRDALVAQQQQVLQRRFNSLQRADNSPMVPIGDTVVGAGQRHTNPQHGKGKSKGKSALTGKKRGFSGGNPPSHKARKTERRNDRRSISNSKSRSPTRSPAGAGLSGSVINTRSRAGAGDIVAPSDRLQNQDGTETDENAFKEYLAKQDEDDVEFVFSDDDGMEETTHGGDGTDDESDAGTVGVPTPPTDQVLACPHRQSSRR
jgi:hypothetical protein